MGLKLETTCIQLRTLQKNKLCESTKKFNFLYFRKQIAGESDQKEQNLLSCKSSHFQAKQGLGVIYLVGGTLLADTHYAKSYLTNCFRHVLSDIYWYIKLG